MKQENEKITAHDYGNADLKISNNKNDFNSLIVSNINWELELCYNLLTTITLI